MVFRLSFLLLTFAHAEVVMTEEAQDFLIDHCYDCHDSASEKGDLNLEDLKFELGDHEGFEKWTLIHDRVRDGEMPPKKKKQPGGEEKGGFLKVLSKSLETADRQRIVEKGRTSVRRLNRLEYENTLRDLLDAPWLQVADRLPEDGTAHLYQKTGKRLDVSHVQMTAYLKTARHALLLATQVAAHPTKKEKFYAREEPGMVHNFWYRFGQSCATRASIPLLGTTAQPEVIRMEQPVTVGESNPEIREQEAIGYVCGTYTATTKYDYRRMEVPTDGEYRIRMKSYTFMAGPNGASGGDDHGLTGGSVKWWRPSRTVAFRGKRSEPVTLYALAESGDSRWLTTYDAHPDPAVIEREVFLKKGEDIRPDAGRLVRTRPGWGGNANATKEGVPGLAFNWLEVEGPLHETWPPPSYKALFGDRSFEVKDGEVKVEEGDQKKLILTFLGRVLQREVEESEAIPYLEIFDRALELGEDFTDAILSTYSAILCSPNFLYLAPDESQLSKTELADRLAYFLWNGPPDESLLSSDDPLSQSQRMLQDPKSRRFINAFLDSWLDLREITRDTPDAELYPDYYLDDLLAESSLRETRLYLSHLIEKNLPVRYLIDSDFTFVNERLAKHYGLPPFEGVEPRLVQLPPESPRGGLLTQASVLRVTANGTTTSPVLRGAWIVERLLGVHIPPPPSGVEAVEPDTRGATTIREQLDLHRNSPSCNSCHVKMDPAGFALESFDVAGGWRDQYRATGKGGKVAKGIGHNGHLFRFHYAQPVDASGVLVSEETFRDIREFKKLMLQDERQLARNMVSQFITYATGSPVSFSEREEVEKILDACADESFRIQDLIHSVVRSPFFAHK